MEPLRQPRQELSPIQLRILQGYSYGLDAPACAEVFGLSQDSVHDQCKYLRRKLRAKNMAQAVANAMRLGILT